MITDAKWISTRQVVDNASLILMTTMDFAFDSLGERLQSAFTGEPVPDDQPPLRAEIIQRIAKVRGEMSINQDQLDLFRRAITDTLADRILALPAKHFSGLPSLATALSDDELADYLLLQAAHNPRMRDFFTEFDLIGQDMRALVTPPPR
jgi:hypothetical protein